MRINDRKPNVIIRVWRGDIVERTIEIHNEWGSAGLAALRNWVASVATTPPPSHVEWVDVDGVGRARDTITQRVLDVDGSGDPTLLIRQFLPSATLANGHDIDTVRLFNSATGGTEFAEATFSPAISKTDEIQITVEWTHTFTDGGV